MIYSFTPFSTEKNFGKAINDCCKIVPNDDDWICIRDGDMMNLTSNWGNIIQDAIDKHGQEYALFGCWTNRLEKGSRQLLIGMYDEMNIKNHWMVAEEMSYDGANYIIPVQKIAGLFMLFQKKTWIQAGGFKENDPTFDSMFSRRVRKFGKIGLINRLYCLHLYRIWSNNPGGDTKHLRR